MAGDIEAPSWWIADQARAEADRARKTLGLETAAESVERLSREMPPAAPAASPERTDP